MTTPLKHVGQTARPEESLQLQQQQQGQHDAGDAAPNQQPTGRTAHPQQQRADFAQRPSEQQQRERQQREVDAEADPASDANTASANHPNDE